MNDADKKADRLLQIEAMLLAHPEGMTQAEIAQRLNVNRSTINRYLPSLPKFIYIDEWDSYRLKIDRSAYLVNVRFSLHEATAVHLASRLLATRMERQNPHAASALRKLGTALEKLAPHISRHLGQSADVMDDAARLHDPNYLRSLEQLTLAWAECRKVRVWHRHMETGQVFDYVFSPYFIEPYAAGQSTHVLGYREPPGAIRTFKIERIERVEPLSKAYQIPSGFDPSDLLADAWGIWYTEAQPVTVVLKFHPQVAQRVRETRWHRSEQVDMQSDGSLLWRAQIAEPQEMLPWIRGWGASVEVLEPECLKQVLKREIQDLAKLYCIVENNEQQKEYYAHSKDGVHKTEWQKLIDHLKNTASLAVELGHDAGVSELAQVAGLMHDIGKYSDGFQRRLTGSSQRVDHATAGAREILSLFPTEHQKDMAHILAYCIAGHHSGLPDYGSVTDVGGEGTLLARLDADKTPLQDYNNYKNEIDTSSLSLPVLTLKRTKNPAFSASFLTRMLFSTLVDADWLETETYMNDGKKPRGEQENIETLCSRLNQFLLQFDNPQKAINQKRTETLKACLEKSGETQGIFTLTVPTGGGKTLASLAFALNHAVQHGLKRIIYVIPFTSIIEQNAAVFKNCLGNENVLEHHSNFDWLQLKRHVSAEVQDDETNKAYEKLKLAAENWDVPIVVTTNVQFFESLFANQKSHCRKLHNMAKSVIIFDEAQMLPREYMRPCMLAVQELVKNYSATAVFCTATQPLLQQFLPDVAGFTELAPDPQQLFDFYKRVHIRNVGTLSDEELLTRMNAQSQTLCIVNTRKHAKGLFDGLEEDGRFHLSTVMCPAHRKETLLTVRARLKNGQTCRVISTQVMEAGIDVDFPVGYRALAGLDSVIQAAGRVNREGKMSSGEIFVFESKSEHIRRTPTYIKQTAAAARSVLRDFSADPDSIEAIQAYFQLLDTLQDPKRASDAKEILTCFDNGHGFNFKTAAAKFRLIENNTVAVIIPFNAEALQLVEELRYSPYPVSTLRKLQNYTVNIYEQEYHALNEKGAISLAADLYAILENMDYYDPETGIHLLNKESGEAIFFG